MSLIPLRPLLEATDKYHYAQGAFNVNSVAQIKAAIEIHETLRSPAILQGADLANGFMGGKVDFFNSTIEDKRRGAKNMGDAVAKYAKAASIPVVLHLDHGKDFESVKAAIDGGYTSVMIDGSALPYEDNLEITREVVKYAHQFGVSVEGELGVLAGVEDHVFSDASTYTHPLQAIDFIRKTGVDALAVSYGTMHGPAKGKNVKLRHEILVAIKEILRHEGLFCGLVSHGSSTVPQYIVEEINQLGGDIAGTEGIAMAELHKAISSGIGKINVDTDLRLATTRNLREYFVKFPKQQTNQNVSEIYQLLVDNPKQIDPRVFFAPIMATIMTGVKPNQDVAEIITQVEAGTKEILGKLIVDFGSVGKKQLIEEVSLAEMAAFYKNQG